MADIVHHNPRGLPSKEFSAPRIPLPEAHGDGHSESLGIRDYLGIIRRQFWIVLSIFVLCVGFALYLVLAAPPRYRAKAVIRLADARQAMTGGGEASAYDQVLGREADVLLSQIQVLMSRQIARSAVDRAGLRLTPVEGQSYPAEIRQVHVAEHARRDTARMLFQPAAITLTAGGESATGPYGTPIEAGGVTVLVARKPVAAAAKFHVISRNDAISQLLDDFKASARPKTDIIDLQYVSGDPNQAQRVANAMALTFQDHNAEGAQQASRRRRIFLEEQMRQTDIMLQRAMGDFSAFRSGQQVFSSKEKASAQQAGIVDVDIRRADLDAQRRTYQSLLRSSQAAEGNLRALVSAPGIAANPVIQQLYQQLTTYEAKRDSFLTDGAAATNPDLVGVSTLVATTTSRLMAAVRNQIQALDAQIDALDNLKVRSTAEIASAPRAETEETRLSQQVQTVQRMADNLQEEHQRAKMAEAVEAGQVEIVDLAEVPTLPVAAGRIRKVALGVIIGLMLGIGAGVLADGMNTAIRRRDDLERILKVPGLAVIPQFMPTDGARKFARALPRRSRNGTESDRAAGLVTVHDARSSGAEAYRTLRTNLIFSQAVQSLRTIVVTSASPSEGKTTTAANLAVSFAQQGMRVLIVDCDLRRSRLHKMFGVQREPGVTELVLGQVTLEDATRDTGVTGLYIMPSGQLPPNPSELLGGNRMRDTLTTLTEAFDLVLIDTPPLLAASDAAILATLADGVVLVVRAGVTEAEAGQQAMQQLLSVGARVVGAVLNDPDSKLETYGGHYKYEYAAEA